MLVKFDHMIVRPLLLGDQGPIFPLSHHRTELGHSSVLVWGHSHGAAVAAIMMAAEADTDSLKLVLESPYNKLQAPIDAIGEWYQR